MSKVKAVNPTFRLDVTGKLFKNKDTNMNPQETLVFSDLYTRLMIEKGDLPLFPHLGLKQHLHQIEFTDEKEIATNLQEFESDVYDQTGRNCTIDYTLDRERKHVYVTFDLEGLNYKVNFVYQNINNSIRIIDNYDFND